MATYQEAFDASLAYYRGDDLPAKTFVDKYALRDREGDYKELTPPDMHRRAAQEFCRIETKYPNARPYAEIEEALLDFRYFVPGGSVLYGIGNPYALVSLSNCFLVTSPLDDMSDIMDRGKDLANIMKRRGGVGIDLSNLRPEGAPVNNAARTSTGAWSFADLYSLICRMIGQGGRRGALMISMDVRHPDVFEFVRMKRDLRRVTGANVSVKLTDAFMRAVQEDGEFLLRWPIEGSSPVVERKIRARTLWDEIIKSVHTSAEPGILLWDNILRELPAQCYADVGFDHKGVNPCAELVLAPLDACRLTSMNLCGFVTNKFSSSAAFDFGLFREKTRLAQRMLDDLVDLELEIVNRVIKKVDNVAEETLWKQIREKGELGRRTGLGTFGLADVLSQLGIRYDSAEALVVVEKIFATLRDASYEESSVLAEERGPFPLWDWEREKNNAFIKRLPLAIRKRIQSFGRRNIANLTNAPTGSVAICAFNSSSGIEPVFRNAYTRRKKISHNEEGSRTDFIDDTGDKWQDFDVFHRNAVDWVRKNYPDWDGLRLPDLPKFFVTADQIDWEKRVELQGVAQKYIDHSISSCMVGGTLVHTGEGFRSLGSLVTKHTEGFSPPREPLFVVNREAAVVPSPEGYYNGVRPVKKVVLEDGSTLTATPNHRLLVLGEDYSLVWRRLDELAPGDVVAERVGLGLWADSSKNTIAKVMGKPWEYDRRTSSKDVKIPTRVNRKIARFLGYLTSDGSLNDNGVCLSQVKNNVVDDFKEIVFSEFGIADVSVARDKRADSELYSVSANSRELRRWCEWVGVTRDCRTKTVPPIVLQSGRRQVAEFIKALTLDGYVREHGLVPLTSASHELLLQVQVLLKNFGILSRIILVNEAGTKRTFPHGNEYETAAAWDLWLNKRDSQRFMDYIGFAEDRKQGEFRTKFRRPSRKICPGALPDFGFRRKIREELLPKIHSSHLYDYLHSASCLAKQGLWVSRELLDVLADLGYAGLPEHCYDHSFNFSEVRSVEDFGEAETFDLSVPETNSYLANAAISHNTLNLPEETPKETIGNIYLRAWEQGLKGVTVYREGCRSGVLVSGQDGRDSEGRPLRVSRTQAPKRPLVLPCDIYHGRVQGEPWTILVGLYKGEPYELFGGPSSEAGIPKSAKSGFLTKVNKTKDINCYNLSYNHYNEGVVVEDIGNLFENKTYGTFTRILSLSLRHGAPVQHIVEQLRKDKSEELNSLSAVLGRALKKYIADGTIVTGLTEGCERCGSKNLKYADGCPVCLDCGYTKCS